MLYFLSCIFFILTSLTMNTQFCYLTLHQTVIKCIMQFKQNWNENLIKFQWYLILQLCLRNYMSVWIGPMAFVWQNESIEFLNYIQLKVHNCFIISSFTTTTSGLVVFHLSRHEIIHFRNALMDSLPLIQWSKLSLSLNWMFLTGVLRGRNIEIKPQTVGFNLYMYFW